MGNSSGRPPQKEPRSPASGDRVAFVVAEEDDAPHNRDEIPARASEGPTLKRADSLPEDEQGEFKFDRKDDDDVVAITNEGKTVQWTSDVQLAWVPCATAARLHSGNFQVDFNIEEMGSRQIGVGFLLDYQDLGPNWGFFGYLGASDTAWSYDPSSGDVVTATNSVEGGLPTFQEQGTVSIKLKLPRDDVGSAMFVVDGKQSKIIEFQEPGSVVVPAACLLKQGQKVTIQICPLEEKN